MTDDKALGPGSIAHIASTVADATSTPEEARRLLAEFVRQADTGNIAPRLIEHVRDCFAAFVAGERRMLPERADTKPDPAAVEVRTLDQAFGLTRARGQPAINDAERALVAMQVLEARLAGRTRDDALGDVADARKDAGLPIHGDTQVLDAWKSHRVMGLIWLRASRAAGGYPWTRDELSRLRKIYEGVPEVTFPAEKSANTPP